MKNFKQIFEQKEIALYEAYQKEEKRKIRKIRLIFGLGVFLFSLTLYVIAMLCDGYTLNKLYLPMYNTPLILVVFVVFSIGTGLFLQWQLYPKEKLRDAFSRSLPREAKAFGTTEFLDYMIKNLKKHFILPSTFQASLIEVMQGYSWYDGEFRDSHDIHDRLEDILILNITQDTYLLQKWEYKDKHFVFHMENINQKKIEIFRFTV